MDKDCLINMTFITAEIITLLILMVDESAAPMNLSWATSAYIAQTVAVILCVYWPLKSQKRHFKDKEHLVHIAAVVYAFSWSVDLANYFMTAY